MGQSIRQFGAVPKSAQASAAATSGCVGSAGLQLEELNLQSARSGSWEVAVFRPWIETFTCADRLGDLRPLESFKCLLVSVDDPSCYIHARVAPCRSPNRRPLEKALSKFTSNRCFRMSQVKFQSAASRSYLHAPLKLVVNLSTTTFEVLNNAAASQEILPQPAMTLSQVPELQQNQLFDATSLVARVGEPQELVGHRGLVMRDVKLIDQSPDGIKAQEFTLHFFYYVPTNRKDGAMIDILRESEGVAQPLTFFALSTRRRATAVSGNSGVTMAKPCFVSKADGCRAFDLIAFYKRRSLQQWNATTARLARTFRARAVLDKMGFMIREYLAPW